MLECLKMLLSILAFNIYAITGSLSHLRPLSHRQEQFSRCPFTSLPRLASLLLRTMKMNEERDPGSHPGSSGLIKQRNPIWVTILWRMTQVDSPLVQIGIDDFANIVDRCSIFSLFDVLFFFKKFLIDRHKKSIVGPPALEILHTIGQCRPQYP